MPTMTSMTSTENDNCVSLRQFLDERRVPYILCCVEVKNGKKSVREIHSVQKRPISKVHSVRKRAIRKVHSVHKI